MAEANASQALARPLAVAKGWSREEIEVIKATCAPDASDAELAMFLHVARQQELDPLQRQIHFVKRRQKRKDRDGNDVVVNGRPVWDERITIQAGVDGMQARALRFSDCEGVRYAAVFEKDDFAVDRTTGAVLRHASNPFVAGRCLGAWAVVDRRGRRPFFVVVRMEEFYDGRNTMWKGKPVTMIEKVARATALRRAYPEAFGGTRDPAEGTGPDFEDRGELVAPAIPAGRATPALAGEAPPPEGEPMAPPDEPGDDDQGPPSEEREPPPGPEDAPGAPPQDPAPPPGPDVLAPLREALAAKAWGQAISDHRRLAADGDPGRQAALQRSAPGLTMQRRNATFSALGRAMACRLSNCLPQTDEASPYAAEGTVFHAFLERVVNLQRLPRRAVLGEGVPEADRSFTLQEARDRAADEAPRELREALLLIDTSTLSLSPDAIAAEAAFAYDVETGKARVLGCGLRRAYGELAPTEYAGTLDRLAMIEPDGAYVGDFKRWGWSIRGPVKENAQLRAGALAAVRAYERAWVDVEIIRLGEDGEPWHSQARLEPFDLDVFAEELREHHGRAVADRAAYDRGELPPATMGDHCRYCPSLPYCPAQMTLARAVLGGRDDELARLASDKLLITPEDAPRLWELLDQAQTLLDRVREAVKDYARATPFQIKDGRMVGPVPSPKREITDGDRAKAVIAEALGRRPGRGRGPHGRHA